ncbi:MAG: HAMP domain-containing histidine kinase [Cytophagales bacterium]|nr:HAMP domain-containing histidine kinase [Cytophagales bacterium]
MTENAIKYQDKSKEDSKLKVDISIDNHELYLVFEDNGLGIPEEVKDRIFDMFYKVENSSNGTGLGLYIVKTSVQKLGGSITLETKLGVGSTFRVKVPLN